jgi:hypothetical protein
VSGDADSDLAWDPSSTLGWTDKFLAGGGANWPYLTGLGFRRDDLQKTITIVEGGSS